MQDPIFSFVQNPYAQLAGVLGGLVTLGGFVIYLARSLRSTFAFFRDVLIRGMKSAVLRQNLRYARAARFDLLLDHGVIMRLINFISIQIFAIGLTIITLMVTLSKLQQYQILGQLVDLDIASRKKIAIDTESSIVLVVSMAAGLFSIIGIWLSSERLSIYNMWVRRISARKLYKRRKFPV